MIDEQAGAEPNTFNDLHSYDSLARTYTNVKTGKTYTEKEILEDKHMATTHEPAGWRDQQPLTHEEMWEHYASKGARQTLHEMTQLNPYKLTNLLSSGIGVAIQGIADPWRHASDVVAQPKPDWFDKVCEEIKELELRENKSVTSYISPSYEQQRLITLQQKLDAAQREIARLTLQNAELLSQIHTAPEQRLSSTWEHLPDVITPATPTPQPQKTTNGKNVIPLHALRQQRQTIGLTTELP